MSAPWEWVRGVCLARGLVVGATVVTIGACAHARGSASVSRSGPPGFVVLVPGATAFTAEDEGIPSVYGYWLPEPFPAFEAREAISRSLEAGGWRRRSRDLAGEDLPTVDGDATWDLRGAGIPARGWLGCWEDRAMDVVCYSLEEGRRNWESSQGDLGVLVSISWAPHGEVAALERRLRALSNDAQDQE